MKLKKIVEASSVWKRFDAKMKLIDMVEILKRKKKNTTRKGLNLRSL